MPTISRIWTVEKIGLNIEMRDFGPIIKGKISLKPLTLFVGPNNSGKSYAAMLIHSMYKTYIPTIWLKDLPHNYPRELFLFRDLGLRTIQKDFEDEQTSLGKQINGMGVGEELEIPKQLLDEINARIFDELYEQRLSKEISRSYASPLNELIRIGKRAFSLKIDFDSDGVCMACKEEQLKIERCPKSDVKIKIKLTDDVDIGLMKISGDQYQFGALGI